jgi:hypothetical protein
MSLPIPTDAPLFASIRSAIVVEYLYINTSNEPIGDKDAVLLSLLCILSPTIRIPLALGLARPSAVRNSRKEEQLCASY